MLMREAAGRIGFVSGRSDGSPARLVARSTHSASPHRRVSRLDTADGDGNGNGNGNGNGKGSLPGGEEPPDADGKS
jgi:hypothetical protein